MKIYRNYIVAILPIVLFYLFCCWDGNLHSPDSEGYLDFAKNLWNHGLLQDSSGQPMIYWPPLFVVFLLPAVGFPKYVILLNLFLLIYHQYIWVKIGKRLLGSAPGLIFYATLLGLNTMILMVAVYVWSELLFMVFFGTAVFCLLQYQQQLQLKYLIAFGLSLGAGLLTRNAGVFLLPGFFIAGFYLFKEKSLKWYFIVLVIASLGNVIWNVHQLFVLGYQSALQELIPQLNIQKSMILTFSELGYFFWPGFARDWFAALLGLTGFLFAILRFGNQQKECYFPVLIFTSYMLFWFVIPASRDDLGRLLAPIMPAFLLLFYSRIGDFLKKPPMKLIFYSISYYLIVISLLRIIRNTITWSNII